jgi:predicted patatin/cPLA2 family phospholipase
VQLASNVIDTALLFEGGGMRASYTAAVVAELLRAGVHPDFVAGISAGSSHAVNFISRDPLRARRSFVDLAADPNFGGLRTLLHGQGFFNSDYLYLHTAGASETLPFDFATFFANPAKLYLGAFRVRDGRQVWFGRGQLTTPTQVMTAVQASSSMPGLMPMVHIQGEAYVDGALGPTGGIPLEIAEQAGYRKFLVILSRPRSYRKPPLRGRRLLLRYFAGQPTILEALLHRHERYNETRERLLELERQGAAYLFFPDGPLVSNRERRIERLAASYAAGEAQIRRELPAIQEFLGLPGRPHHE